MKPAIAVVGMACRYPDAKSPYELWQNTLAKRRAFRRIPNERLRLEDYFSEDKDAPDLIYASQAALIEGYEFDRVKYRVMGSTYRSADLTHWLALDIAAQALNDAGLVEENPMRETTGVIVGNTLTGEFTRAGTMRLRWPYVERNVDASLLESGWDYNRRSEFLGALEERYKASFPPVTEESLAGGLSNTIAGRICNYFNFQGGGYTVDGACASSLLAVASACSSLVSGDLDAAVAGGVDLSIDPFELVGFAKTGALAAEEMRVFDARSAGFWPGEGCGFVVLMRYDDAVAQGRRIHAVIRGWGISSDGSGGITRPEADGQLLALKKAYRRAGFGIDTVAYFEGHGTGTSVGDATELAALTRARHEADAKTPAVVGSIKGTIGHTKAAAGMAGFFNAALALRYRTLPPQAGCQQPHALVSGGSAALRVLHGAEPWPANLPLRAGISGMGFGGINAHLVVEGSEDFDKPDHKHLFGPLLRSSAQDAELFLLAGDSSSELMSSVDHLLTFAARISRAEMSDLAAALAANLREGGFRAAVVAARPDELNQRLLALREHIVSSESSTLHVREGWFYGGDRSKKARIGFLFPGQGVPLNADGGLWRRRFDSIRDRYAHAALPDSSGDTGTEVAQPFIVTACLAALDLMETVGITAEVAVGHSLGELVALHWAGAFDEHALMRIATVRGKAMAAVSGPRGAMASISASAEEVSGICTGCVVSGINSFRQTVASGTFEDVEAVIQRAHSAGWHAVRLPVSHAFHSPLMHDAVPALKEAASSERPRTLNRTIFSTISGDQLSVDADIAALLCDQLTSPVRFLDAFTAAQSGIDLWLELGPGQVLSGLASGITSTPAIPLQACGASMQDLLLGVGACFVLGAVKRPSALFTDRFVRPFSLNWQPKFFQNPCELAPIVSMLEPEAAACRKETGEPASLPVEDEAPPGTQHESASTTLDTIRKLVAQRTELPESTISGGQRFLTDLHLNSITVGELIVRAARESGVPVPSVPLDFADASIADAARVLDESRETGGRDADDLAGRFPAGVAPWIEGFTVEWTEAPLVESLSIAGSSSWQVIAPSSCRFTDSLRSAFASAPSGGIVVCLPAESSANTIDLLLESARALSTAESAERYVMVQKGCVGAAFARTLALESPGIITCVVDAPQDHEDAASWVVREALTAVRFTESRYNWGGIRFEPRLRHCRPLPEAEILLGPDDVLLVSGGGKGIATECALALVQRSGARLLILGRSDPEVDVELANNLARLNSACNIVRYVRADVTDSELVPTALREAQAEIGPVTAILHGAGRNVPCSLRDLTLEAFRSTVATKVDGLRNLLSGVDPSGLRLLVSFGSIIARSGLHGEADYAVANAMLTEFVEQWQAENAHCRCVNLEWSVWAGAGMAERMGRVEALARQGIAPISIDQGVTYLVGLLKQPFVGVSRIVTGRFGDLPTLPPMYEDAPLPFTRFLEQPRIYYADVELIADAVLSSDTDPYLNDHVFAGERLLPGVIGIEAAAQAAMALARSSKLPRFEDIEFLRPIVVPEGGQITVRTGALQRRPGCIDIVLRSDATGFQVDHFRVSCHFDVEHDDAAPEALAQLPPIELGELLAARGAQELYETLLFQTGRFKRLCGYRLLRAKECIAEIGDALALPWFGAYLPSALVLGDAGAHDAAIHAIQACIPHATLLPVGIERITLGPEPLMGPCIAAAKETSQEGDLFVYNVMLYDLKGSPRESWKGLRLRRVADRQTDAEWPEILIGPYLERMIALHLPSAPEIAVILTSDGPVGSTDRTTFALRQLLGRSVQVRRRPDGKPETDSGISVSSAHCGQLTFAVSGTGTLSCDAELVVKRDVAVWKDLLGESCFALAELTARVTDEDMDHACTRTWSALETLKKVGRRQPLSIVLESTPARGWAILSNGDLKIATYCCRVSARPEPVVLAILTGN